MAEPEYVPEYESLEPIVRDNGGRIAQTPHRVHLSKNILRRDDAPIDELVNEGLMEYPTQPIWYRERPRYGNH